MIPHCSQAKCHQRRSPAHELSNRIKLATRRRRRKLAYERRFVRIRQPEDAIPGVSVSPTVTHARACLTSAVDLCVCLFSSRCSLFLPSGVNSIIYSTSSSMRCRKVLLLLKRSVLDLLPDAKASSNDLCGNSSEALHDNMAEGARDVCSGGW